MSTTSSDAQVTPGTTLLNDQQAIERIFGHIDNKTTDLGDEIWRAPVEQYYSQERFDAEISLLRRLPVPYCPSAALPDSGSFIARTAAGTPLLVARGADGTVRAFINACRHRGMQVAEGTGCSKAFTCPYHAWTYDLEGALKGIPGRSGFADLDADEHGLAEVNAAEKGGIVYVAQDGPIDGAFLDDCLDLFTPEQEMFEQNELVDEANWKLLNETLQEGYHIKSLHRDSFYPYGYDNMTVVETFGANSRVIFPFRRIEKLRDVAPDQRQLAGVATSVYNLFPNASVAVLSKHTNLVVLEPISPTRTRWVIYQMLNRQTGESPITLEEAQRDSRFVNDFGQDEDREAARAIQESVTTRANTHFTFGHYEKAIVNFHHHLALHLDYLYRIWILWGSKSCTNLGGQRRLCWIIAFVCHFRIWKPFAGLLEPIDVQGYSVGRSPNTASSLARGSAASPTSFVSETKKCQFSAPTCDGGAGAVSGSTSLTIDAVSSARYLFFSS